MAGLGGFGDGRLSCQLSELGDSQFVAVLGVRYGVNW